MRTGAPAGVVLMTMLRDLGGRARLPADQAEHQLVIGLDQAGRIDHVAAADGVENVGNGDAGLHQLGGVGLHFELRHLAALHHHRRDAGLAVEPRLEVVVGQSPRACPAGTCPRSGCSP